MRALRVLGLADGVPGATRSLLLEDASSGEQFSARCDDRLLAAARGESAAFDQPGPDQESQLRPKEIQARIRAGATVEQLAALAGTSMSRVERFAYPVLLERASVAERAMKARPAIDGITGAASVAETVVTTLAARGQTGGMSWDAHKEDDGWMLTLTWSAGRTENRARWLFHPGPDGGTLSARDDAAAEIVDPALRVLRPLRPVRPEVAPGSLVDLTAPTTSQAPSRPSEAASRSVHPAGGGSRPAVGPGAGLAGTGHPPSGPAIGRPRFDRQPLPTSQTGRGPIKAEQVYAWAGENAVAAGGGGILDAAAATGNAQRSTAGVTTGEPIHAGRLAGNLLDGPVGRSLAGPAPSRPSATALPTGSALPSGSALPTATALPPATALASAAGAGLPARIPARGTGRRSNRPAMPSWENVLLGTRSETAGR